MILSQGDSLRVERMSGECEVNLFRPRIARIFQTENGKGKSEIFSSLIR